jgi:hypothetical protein
MLRPFDFIAEHSHLQPDRSHGKTEEPV